MQKAKWHVFILALAWALSFSGAQALAAPRPAGQKQPEQAAKKAEPQNTNVYRVKYTIREVENGKAINERSYLMMVKPGARAHTYIGSRVPYYVGKNNVGQSQYQFQDIGVNIHCVVTERENNLLVETTLDMSSLASEKALLSDQSQPVLGQLRLEDDTLAEVGKPALVGSADDPTSNRRYVVEVMVTKAM